MVVARPDSRVTATQRRICNALVTTNGTTNAIAEALGMNPATVRTHMQNLIDMVGADTRVEVAVWWILTGRFLPERRSKRGQRTRGGDRTQTNPESRGVPAGAPND